ncbi:hypothetical protein H4S08_004448 [Coemansia sp. RSA 1365]|nr:hypothetical protein H4S08_004448 [Coemansia sp. RSA 1365]
MLSGMHRNAREVRAHFLIGLDQEVRIMFIGCFPTWLEDGKLDKGYVYISELYETVNTVKNNILWFAKFHQAMNKAILAEYGALMLNRPGPMSASAAAPQTTGGNTYLPTGTTAASGACTDSCRFVDDDPMPTENKSGEASWPEDGLTEQRVNIFDEFSGNDNSDLEVCMVSVEPVRETVLPAVSNDTQLQAMQGTDCGGPAAESALLEP